MSGAADPESVADVVLDGKYRLGPLLGCGAFSWVFEASHTSVDGLVYAVKVLRAEHTGSADLERRFTNEIRALAAMNSPYTVRVSDAGKTADGNPYLVMEKLIGVTLRDLIVGEGPLHPLHAARFALDILRALEAAHKTGVVHRDLKPSNIFIIQDGQDGRAGAKVVDFGIAKILGSSFLREPEHESTVDSTPCTPTYAAPEQLRQAPSPQSDLYALGHVLAFTLQGEAPYSGTGAFAVIAQHLSNEAVPLPTSVTESPLGEFVAKACQKSEDLRWQSAREMIDALLLLIDDLESLNPALPQPHLPARLNFGGSGDFTAPNTWSMMSVAGPTRASKREKPVSNLPPEDETARLRVTTEPGRSNWFMPLATLAIAVAALSVALLARDPSNVGESPVPESSIVDSDAGPEPTPTELAPAQIEAAVRTAADRVLAGSTVPPAHRWTVAARRGGGEAWLEIDGRAEPARPLPIDGGFGPATRPVTLFVALERGELREQIEDSGPVVMTDLRIARPADNDSQPADTAPRPGSLDILLPNEPL